MMRKLFTWLVVASAGGLLVAGCGSSSTATKSAQTAPAAATTGPTTATNAPAGASEGSDDRDKRPGGRDEQSDGREQRPDGRDWQDGRSAGIKGSAKRGDLQAGHQRTANASGEREAQTRDGVRKVRRDDQSDDR